LGARYEQGGREDKARILDEFAPISSYHRKLLPGGEIRGLGAYRDFRS
jgi:hypothetical protein